MYKKFIKNKLEFFLEIVLKKKQFINNSKRKVLIECAEDPFYVILFALIVEKNFNKNNVSLYESKNFYVGEADRVYGSILRRLFKSLLNYKYRKLYKNFCRGGFGFSVNGVINPILLLIAFREAINIWGQLNTKEDLINLKLENIHIGDLIYDTYLRFRPAPTVDIRSKYLLFLLLQSILSHKKVKSYLKKNLLDIIMMSYSTYISNGILARVALAGGVKVYTFGNIQDLSKELTLADPYQTKNSLNYKNHFELLENKSEFLKRAQEALNEKINGKIISSISYMKHSSYHDEVFETIDLNGLIVIFLHDFYDSPHIYRWMIFSDFYDWVDYTINFFKKNGIKFCIKPHPNALSENKDILNEIKNKYPEVQIIDSRVSNLQLVKAGIIGGVTVYGTIGHELPFLGVPVVACGDNPHVSYSFCHTAKNINDYNNYLFTLSRGQFGKLIPDEILSFFFMHNLNCSNEIYEINKLVNRLRVMCNRYDEKNNYKVFYGIKKLDKLISRSKLYLEK